PRSPRRSSCRSARWARRWPARAAVSSRRTSRSRNRRVWHEREVEEPMQHLEEGTIHAWLDGALPPDEAAAVDAHVRSCAACAAAVAEARGMIAGAARIVSALDIARGGVLPSAPARQTPRPASGSSMWRRLHLTPSRAALAATILVAVAGTLVVRHQRPLAEAIDQGRRIDSPIVLPKVAQPPRRDSSPVVPTVEHRAPIKRSAIVPPSAKATESNGPLTAPATAPLTAPVTASAPVPTPSRAPTVPASAAAPMAARVTSGTAVNTDSLVARPVAKSAERANFAPIAASGGRAAARNVLESAAETSVPRIVGCFQLSSQPTDSAFRSLPGRFALERGGANPRQNIVRSLSPEGRIDSVVAGTSWRQPAPNQVSIVFADNGVINRTVELELDQALATTRTSGGASFTLPIRRVDCVR